MNNSNRDEGDPIKNGTAIPETCPYEQNEYQKNSESNKENTNAYSNTRDKKVPERCLVIRDTVDFDNKNDYFSANKKNSNIIGVSDDEKTNSEDMFNDPIDEIEEMSNENSKTNAIKSSEILSRKFKTSQSSTPLNVKLKLQVNHEGIIAF
jgi:hypothetical protein